jgi:hypothetical protein
MKKQSKGAVGNEAGMLVESETSLAAGMELRFINS